VGVYPQAVLQSFDASPVTGVTDFGAVQGVTAAAQHCPGVISISFGGTSRDPQLEDAVLGAFHNGCLVVAAVGNGGLQGSPPEYPASYPHVLTVGATDQSDTVAALSTLSPALDVAAPGIGMVAAVPFSHDPSGYSSNLSGTSFATPLVSAAAAWVWTLRPTLDVTQIFELMRQSARDVGPPGFDSGSGFGIVSIPSALAAAAPAPDPAEPNDDVDQIRPGALFPDGRPLLTTAAKPSIRIAARIDGSEDPRDLYRIWVPAHRVVRATVSAGGAAAARIWGPRTAGVGEEHPLAATRPEGAARPRRQAGLRRLRRGAAHGADDHRELRAQRHGFETLTPAVPSRPPGRTPGFVTRTSTRSAPNRCSSSSAIAVASASSRS